MQQIKKFYSLHLKKYGKDDIRGMGWHDEHEYPKRFQLTLEKIKGANPSILDVGCGFGGLYKYLVGENIKCDYLGIDIMPEMIKIAKEKNPTGNFEEGDILKEKLSKFDYVISIGSLNIKSEDNDFFIKMVEAMIKIAKKAVILNFLSDSNYLVKGPYHFQSTEELKERLEKKYRVDVEIEKPKELMGESIVMIRRN